MRREEISRLSSATELLEIAVEAELFAVGAVLFVGFDVSGLPAISTFSCRSRRFFNGRRRSR